MEHKAIKDSKVPQGLTVLMEHKAQPAHKVFPDLAEYKALKEQLAVLEHKELLEVQEHKGVKGLLGQQVPKATKELLEVQEHKEVKGLLGQQVPKATKELLEVQEHKEVKGHKAIRAVQGRREQ
jgi:hypothetical protein